MLMRSKVTYQGQVSFRVKLGGKCWFSLFGSPLKAEVQLEKTWFKDAVGISLHVNEVKGHVPKSRVILVQVSWKK